MWSWFGANEVGLRSTFKLANTSVVVHRDARSATSNVLQRLTVLIPADNIRWSLAAEAGEGPGELHKCGDEMWGDEREDPSFYYSMEGAGQREEYDSCLVRRRC